MIFQFREFSIKQEKSAMKIGTDSVLLGSICETADAQRILDIGTGTGLLALMLAQKSTAQIEGIEIDENAFEEATFNSKNSPWNQRVQMHLGDVTNYSFNHKFDIIISNPPYYKHKANMSIEDVQRSRARHDEDLNFDTLCKFAFTSLNEAGAFWLILPVKEAEQLKKIAISFGFYLQSQIDIKPKPTKQANRMIMKFGKQEASLKKDVLVVYNDNGTATSEYIKLTKSYYLWKQLDVNLGSK